MLNYRVILSQSCEQCRIFSSTLQLTLHILQHYHVVFACYLIGVCVGLGLSQ